MQDAEMSRCSNSHYDNGDGEELAEDIPYGVVARLIVMT